MKDRQVRFGHDGVDGGADSTECLPSCQFYNETGEISALEVLEDYREFQGFDKVLRIWNGAHK